MREELTEMRPTVNVTRVITEEDTTKGSKGTQHVCLESYRRLDAIDIVGRCEHRTTRHLEMTLWMWLNVGKVFI